MADPVKPFVYADQFRNITDTAPVAPAPLAPAVLEQGARRLAVTGEQQREAMFNQDNTLTGLLNWRIGSQFTPEDGYNPAGDLKGWNDLKDGVQPEFQHELLGAVSPAHAWWLKDRLLTKQRELQTLGDLTTMGNVGRFGYGLLHGMIDPINVPTMALATPARFLGKLAFAAGGGIVQERVRQQTNYENNTNQLLDAALTSAIFASPFAALSSAGRRMQERALREKAVFEKKQAGLGESRDYTAERALISEEQRAINEERWDTAEELEAIRVEAEKEQLFRQMQGEDLDLDVTSPGETPVRVKLKDGVATEDFPTKTPMQIALEKAGLVQERERVRAEEQAKAEAEARVKAAAEQQKQTEAKWAKLFASVDENGSGALLSAVGRTPEERANAVTQGSTPRPIEAIDADARDIEALNKTVHGMVRGGKAAFDARPVLHADAGLQALADGFAQLYGRRIVYFRDAAGKDLASGVFVRQLGDTLFVRHDAPHVAQFVAMHEFFHSLRQADPARYEQFRAGVANVLQNAPEYFEKFKAEYAKKGIDLPTPDKINEEFLADLVEKLVTDTRLQELMQRREGGMIRQFIANLLDFLEQFAEKLAEAFPKQFARFKGALPSDPFLAQHVSDINQFRRKLAKFITQADAAVRRGEDGAVDSTAPAKTFRERQVETENFKRWFGSSKIVDKDGRPLIVYHGTPFDFSEFKQGVNEVSGQYHGNGHYFGSASVASDYSINEPGSNVMPVYLKMEKPFYGHFTPDEIQTLREKMPGFEEAYLKWRDEFDPEDVPDVVSPERLGVISGRRNEFIQESLETLGYDGRIVQEVEGDHITHYTTEFVVFHSDQVKSAIGNNGDFSGPDIMFSAVSRAMDAPVLPSVPKGAPMKTTWANARLDYVATIMKGTNEVHKDIVNRMVRDVLGGDGTNSQGWTASEWATSIIRRASFPAHAEMQKQFNLAAHELGWGWWKKQTNNKDFYEAVSRVKRGDMSPIEPGAPFEKVAAQVKAAAAAADQAYSMVLKELRDAGVKGAEAITHDPKYVNRVWRQDKLKEAIMKYGQGPVFQMVANSFTSPELRGDVVKAEQFVKAIMRLEYTPAMRELTLQSPDMKRLRNELDAAGLTPDDADLIVEVMLGQKTREPDAGQATNLRGRMGLEEGLAHRMPDGSTMRVTDFFENDIRVLMDNYVRTLAGHAGMARQGIPDAATFERYLNEARTEHETQGALFGGDSSSFNRNEQHLRDLYDVLTGRPMSHQTFNRFDRILVGLRGLTRGALLGQLGVAQALELNNAAGMFGLQAVMHHSPSLAALIRQARKGAIFDDTLQQQLQHMFGTGMEMSAAYMRDNEYSDFAYGRGPDNTLLDKVTNRIEKAGNAVSHGIDVVSGNRLFTSFTRSFATRWAIQQMVDMANGRGPGVSRERFKGLGLNEADIDPFLADLRTYAKVDGKGTVHEIDWEAWQANNPQSYDQFTLVTMRRVRDAIQDHDVGETMPWMHTTLGKVFSELRTFMLVAHGKQFLKNLYYRDREAFQLFTLSLVAQSLGYVVQASVNNADNQERREKALEPDRIAKAAIQRMSMTGVLPMLFESGYWVATGGKSFFGGGSFNTDSRNFLMTPSMTMATRAMEGAKVVGGAINPWSDAVTTQKEMRSLYGLLPGSNTYLIRNLISQLVEDLPKSEVGQRP